MNQNHLLPPVHDEAKVRFHNKPPSPNSLINPLTSSLPLFFLSNDKLSISSQEHPLTFTVMSLSSGNSLRPLFTSLSSLSTCAFSSSSSLWNWLCPSPLCWCCSDRKTHPPPAALSLSLPDSHWLPVRGDITLLLYPPASLPPSSSVPSLALSSPHSLWILTIPLLYPPVLPPPSFLYSIASALFFIHVYSLDPWSCSYYCSYIHPCSSKHYNSYCALAYSTQPMAPQHFFSFLLLHHYRSTQTTKVK